ncbi:hypothetical protein COX86_03735 [Candidatus Micrarchaeota archaeon CG_4_10_14_0_2_um_filter_60_11]|nr:MAG: hypothetical protein AUJ16_02365 [Candidatus Micrarchaeota archaeon CG1_02_60_51]PIN96589.1 MAG: hypothetical protein COU39_00605 [Candidatus Micrarchaeota archaeon CG10_big_fil_rev_8_21_14_0_10_60_32]PIO02186.1 MAG: hypothetical protein COT58_01250 [Candidatus Micrarchaeota archaeon CG09_land_8_20_14_0_10_60_16]PIZ90655.1 MAG: hypothetical protein COX86_03735 [Candidatus Micrarchaeota archaeon CG_4_10_14_0_2_um_filter_60_11]
MPKRTEGESGLRKRVDGLLLQWHPENRELAGFKSFWERRAVMRLAKKHGEEAIFPILEKHGYEAVLLLREHGKLFRLGERELPGFREKVLGLMARTHSLGVVKRELNNLYSEHQFFQPFPRKELEEVLEEWEKSAEKY